VDRANISRLSRCRKWLIGAFIDPVAVGRFSGRLPDADMVRRSHDKTEGSKEIGSLEQSTTLVTGRQMALRRTRLQLLLTLSKQKMGEPA
jgi:hypothetical protein